MPLLKWGIEREDRGNQELRKSHSTLKVVHSGLWIDTERAWLALSPEGLICDKNGEVLGILQIKCPFSAREMTLFKQHKPCHRFFAR